MRRWRAASIAAVGAVGGLAVLTSARTFTVASARAAEPVPGCDRATPLKKVALDGKTPLIARLENFDILGVGTPSSRVVTAPLYPNYPAALLVGGIGIESRRRLTAPVTLTASYCSGGRVRLFSFTGTNSPHIPRPASATVVRRTGFEHATLFWPPPISSPPDKPQWLVTLYFYKPGLAVLRFAQHGRVIDRLTFRVCVAGGPRLTCR